MYLVELLLPLYDNDGRAFGAEAFEGVRAELAETFGGVTAFQRSPAVGVWKDDEGEVSHDEVVIFEVMAGKLDHAWWARYRKELELRFSQEKIVARATEFEQL